MKQETVSPPHDLRAETWLPLLHDALAEHGRFTFPLRGASMRPALPAQCDIDIVPLPAAPRLGQLIVFASGDALVAHRLVRRSGRFWVAQGDNRRGPDRPLQPEQVLGAVAAARVGGRTVWPHRAERPWAMLMVARYHLLRAVRWAGRQVRRWMPR